MLFGGADRCNGGIDGSGIDGGRLISRQAEQNGAIGGVAHPGESERAIEIDLDTRNAIELAAVFKTRARSGRPRAWAPWYANWKGRRRS